MANFTTSADLIVEILRRSGEPTDSSSQYYDDAIIYLNRAYQGIWSGGRDLDPEILELWWWMRKSTRGAFNLQGAYSQGTIDLTKGSASATLSSPPASSAAGWYLKLNGVRDLFQISAHTGGLGPVTLDAAYTVDTDAAAEFNFIKLEYYLASDLIFLLGPLSCPRSNRKQLNILSELDLDRLYPKEDVPPQVPNAACFISTKKIRVNGYSSDVSTDLFRVDYSYNAAPADLADDAVEPVVPREYRSILVDWATSFIMVDKDDDRAGAFLSQARSGLQSMLRDQRRRMATAGREFASIRPRNSMNAIQGPIRTSSGLIVG